VTDPATVARHAPPSHFHQKATALASTVFFNKRIPDQEVRAPASCLPSLVFSPRIGNLFLPYPGGYGTSALGVGPLGDGGHGVQPAWVDEHKKGLVPPGEPTPEPA
jgi:hypothetical protein